MLKLAMNATSDIENNENYLFSNKPYVNYASYCMVVFITSNKNVYPAELPDLYLLYCCYYS